MSTERALMNQLPNGQTYKVHNILYWKKDSNELTYFYKMETHGHGLVCSENRQIPTMAKNLDIFKSIVA